MTGMLGRVPGLIYLYRLRGDLYWRTGEYLKAVTGKQNTLGLPGDNCEFCTFRVVW